MLTKKVRYQASLAVAGVVLALTASGCDVLSDETEQKGKDALCASADASMESLRSGGASAKAVASAIYDAADDERVKKAAKAVRDGEADEQAVETLVAWMDEVC